MKSPGGEALRICEQKRIGLELSAVDLRPSMTPREIIVSSFGGMTVIDQDDGTEIVTDRHTQTAALLRRFLRVQVTSN